MVKTMPSASALIFTEEMNKKFATEVKPKYEFSIVQGRKYDKIVISTIWDGYKSSAPSVSKSIHAFVERESGHLLKAANYSSPAKNKHGKPDTRYIIREMSEIKDVVKIADVYGSYLYADKVSN